jgi:hypothetical protein
MTVKQILIGLLLASWVLIAQASIYAFDFDDSKSSAKNCAAWFARTRPLPIPMPGWPSTCARNSTKW